MNAGFAAQRGTWPLLAACLALGALLGWRNLVPAEPRTLASTPTAEVPHVTPVAVTIPTELSEPLEVTPAAQFSPSPVKARIITFDNLKFDIKKNQKYEPSMLTTEIEQMKGQRVRIRGFIHPMAQQKGNKRFVFVRDNLECCFGPGAMIYDCILVDMAPGLGADYRLPPFAVEGELDIAPYEIGGQLMCLFRLKNATVQ